MKCICMRIKGLYGIEFPIVFTCMITICVGTLNLFHSLTNLSLNNKFAIFKVISDNIKQIDVGLMVYGNQRNKRYPFNKF